MTKLLTIAIPTYNRSKACIKTVQNFVDQIKENNLENKVQILVSDNASKDDTFIRLKEIQLQNPNILLINTNNENLGFAKNCQYLLENTTSKYIWTCGDDDTYSLTALKTVINHLENKDIVYLFINCWWPKKNKELQKGVRITTDFLGTFIEAMNIIRDSASYM